MKYRILFFINILIISFVYSQERMISGTIQDDEGLFLTSVTISNLENGLKTLSNSDGFYSIIANQGATINFSFIGKTSKQIQVGSSNEYNIILVNNNYLEEVIRIGYGVQKKSEITGSISQINGDEISSLSSPSFDGLLAGRASGVQVTTQNGILGNVPRIRIRGISSITSDTYPLFVVDGIPIYTGSLGGYASSNSLSGINPADIESVEILKDGSASAIYGSRAANGVVLISTKKGSSDKLIINYDSYFGITKAVNVFDLLNGEEFVTISNEKTENAGIDPWAVANDINSNWQNVVFNNQAFQQNHSLSTAGATKNLNYYLSLGLTDQNGLIVGNDFKRYSLRINLNQKVSKWLSFGINTGFSRSEYNGLDTSVDISSGNIVNAKNQAPNVAIYNSNHSTGFNIDTERPDVVSKGDNYILPANNLPNIAYILDKNTFYTKVNRLISTIYGDVKVAKELNFRLQVGIDQATTDGLLYYDPIHGMGRGSYGRVENSSGDLFRWNWQNILTYDKTLNKNHNIRLVGITEYQKQRNQNFSAIGTELADAFFNQGIIFDAFAVKNSTGSITENGFVSYAGRFNYNFKDKYFVQASIRRDGLSSLPTKNKYGTFPGGSIGWVISEEGFMKNWLLGVSDLKVRTSFGKVGNVFVGNYPYQGLYTTGSYGDLNGLGYSQLSNPNLEWETSTKYDIGIDLGLFDNRFNLTYDYFINQTEELILGVETPSSIGIPLNQYLANIGEINNQGHELGLDSKLRVSSDFNLNLGANISFVKNRVEKLYNGIDMFSANNVNIIREGKPIFSIYGYKYWGVNASNGNPVYYKADGSLVQGVVGSTGSYVVFDPLNPSDISIPSSLNTQTDRTILGSSIPKYFGAFTSEMIYKDFDLSFLARFSGGNVIFNDTRRGLLTQSFNNNGKEILGRWQSVENTGDGITPKLWADENTIVNLSTSATSRFLESGDFIKLDYITLGYSIPKKTLNKIKITKLRFFVQGQGLITLTNYSGLDPEMEINGIDRNGNPLAKSITAGLNLNF